MCVCHADFKLLTYLLTRGETSWDETSRERTDERAKRLQIVIFTCLFRHPCTVNTPNKRQNYTRKYIEYILEYINVDNQLNKLLVFPIFWNLQKWSHAGIELVKVKGRALDIAPQVDTATAEALRYMARTKRRRTYLSYTFPAIAGTHLPTPRGWRVE